VYGVVRTCQQNVLPSVQPIEGFAEYVIFVWYSNNNVPFAKAQCKSFGRSNDLSRVDQLGRPGRLLIVESVPRAHKGL
jgi:hypothetical protein